MKHSHLCGEDLENDARLVANRFIQRLDPGDVRREFSLLEHLPDYGTLREHLSKPFEMEKDVLNEWALARFERYMAEKGAICESPVDTSKDLVRPADLNVFSKPHVLVRFQRDSSSTGSRVIPSGATRYACRLENDDKWAEYEVDLNKQGFRCPIFRYETSLTMMSKDLKSSEISLFDRLSTMLFEISFTVGRPWLLFLQGIGETLVHKTEQNILSHMRNPTWKWMYGHLRPPKFLITKSPVGNETVVDVTLFIETYAYGWRE